MFQALETAVKSSWGTSQRAEGNGIGEGGIKVLRTGAGDRQGSDQANFLWCAEVCELILRGGGTQRQCVSLSPCAHFSLLGLFLVLLCVLGG